MYNCYKCYQTVAKQEWEQVEALWEALTLLDGPNIPRYDLLADQLGFLHCAGPATCFDANGHAVCCRTCFESACTTIETRK
jgi:hypothetical protein